MIVREPGYYWIKRSLPDGPPEWEIAQYVLNDDLGPRWYVAGSSTPQREITTPGASNRWVVGERILDKPVGWKGVKRR